MNPKIAIKVEGIGSKFVTDINSILQQTALDLTDILVKEDDFKEYPRQDVENLAYAIIRQQLKSFLISFDTKKK